MANNDVIYKIEGYAIFIEAGILSFINFVLFGDHKSILYLIIPGAISATEILAILTILLLSIGFVYYIGYFIGARLSGIKIILSGGGSLSTHILPYGAIFILAIFIIPIMIFLSSPQFSDIRIFTIITFWFVFCAGLFNEYLVNKYNLRKNLNEYLFSWDEIPGNDNGKLVEFLGQKYDIYWVKTAKIEKIDDGRTINVSTEKNSLSLRLNDEKTKVNLKIDDGRIFELNARMENSKLNILNDTPPLDKQIKEIQERLDQTETRQKEQEKRLSLLECNKVK